MQCSKPINLAKEGNLAVPCGKCIQCRISRSREWAVRCIHELGYHEKSVFITLTYNDENLPGNLSLNKKALRDFFKRLRRRLEYQAKSKIRYLASGEYGERNGRPHYHAIIFGLGLDEADQDLIKDCWSFGFIYAGSVTYDSARYVADYILKKIDGDLSQEYYGEKEKPFQIQSMGLGKQFALDNQDSILQDYNITIHGKSVGLPKYYKKILPVDQDILVSKAIERSLEIEIEHTERSGFISTGQSIAESRKQAARNAIARVKLSKKGKM